MTVDVTPVLLTLDEEPNLERTLAALAWAREVVLVDSGSRDRTLELAARAGNVRVLRRPFDNHAAQWNFAVHDTGIRSEWVLALDADHVLGAALTGALLALDPQPHVAGYRARFVYCMAGRALRGSLYPPRVVLFRRARGHFVQQGHTQRLCLEGAVGMLPGSIRHDDRKSFARWLQAQWRYARLEAALLDTTPWPRLGWSGRIRRLLLPAAPVVFAWSLLLRGGVLDGLPGLAYALQRAVAEALIALALVERRLGAHEENGAGEC